ncbi:MAG: PSD1 domain-containing protein [Planctomycetes bacterium]|nr:PSD1 domain-containing protein [Planctomycetota bacterium]
MPTAARLLAAGALLMTVQPSSAQDATAIRFNRDVRPILSSRCFPCHGSDARARKAGLRLDTLAGQRGAIDGRRTVVPGDADASELIRRVTATDPKLAMPPPDSKLELTAAQLATLRAWIDQGADFEDHWAFLPPARPPVPAADPADSWSRTPIDRFVRRRLDAAGLEPQPEADRTSLIRRLSLDLTGLPPTPERVDAFVADARPDAYERLVDELLASPHYGERMAQLWLDIARYADTNGFHHDNIRTAWPYRDWVIRAFDADLPYDEFTVEQLAGDMLPDPDDPTLTEQRQIASGFCRMHNINDEGGAIDEEYRVEAVSDRIETIATAFMGLTFTCARCHDHKYDPFTQDDYYSLAAYFDSVEERGVYSNAFEPARAYPPRILYEPPALQAELATARASLAGIESEIDAVRPTVDLEREQFEVGLRTRLGLEWVDSALDAVTTASDAPVEHLEDGSVRLGSRPPRDAITFRLRVPPATDLRVLRLDALTDEAFPDRRVGLAANGNAVVSAVDVTAVAADDPSRRRTVRWAWAWADHEQANGDHDVLNLVHAGTQGEGWALDGHGRPGPRTALLIAAEPFGFEAGTELSVTIRCESRYDGHVVGRPRVAVARVAAVTGDALLEEVPLAIGDWWMSGPHRGGDFDDLWDRRFGPEDAPAIDRGASFDGVGWKHRPDVADGTVVALRGERSVWYWARELRTPTPRRVTVRLGSDDAVRAFLDGREVLANRVMRGAAPDQERVELTVPAGEHVLVVKVVNNGGPGGFAGRVDLGDDDPERLSPAAWIPRTVRTPDLSAAFADAFGRRSPTFRALDDRRSAATAALAALQEQAVPVLVMKELPEPRPTYVLARGRYDMADESRPVSRRPPLALGGELPPGAPNDRLGFARWLTRPDHPLFARVHVNRLWEMLFGTGLVATSENFGQQADWPSHPELLDWLATTFAERGFSQKDLLRTIVTSAVYRQRAVTTPEARRADPGNRLLSHFPRRRLPAEFVRDVALAASGLLVDTIGGPSVRPYQPDGLWREVSIGGSSNTQVFRRDDGEALHRRSIYTFWKRTSPSPQMLAFDAPTREFCVVRRATTNTPLQALTLWNDEQFVEAARALASRALREQTGDELRLERLFRLCTARAPEPGERDVLAATLAGFRERYAAAPDDARALLGVGTVPAPDDTDPAELASWTLVASAVLSLDETIVRD